MSKKIYILLADGFETIEALAPLDVLKRCSADVVTVSISDSLEVKSSQGVEVKADILLSNANLDDGLALILPGGYPGYVSLRESEEVQKLVKNYDKTGKIIAAICGAPTIFSTHKLLTNRNLTAHSSVADEINKDNNYTGDIITKDGNIITCLGAGHSIHFGFAIAKEFFTKEEIEKAKIGMELF